MQLIDLPQRRRRRRIPMANDDKETRIQESVLKKGGLDTRPLVARPAKAPKGQNPESSDSSATDSNNSD